MKAPSENPDSSASNAGIFDPLATIPVGAFVLRDLADGSTECLFASNRFREMMGLTGDLEPDVGYSELVKLLHPDDLEECIRWSDEATTAGQPFQWEGRMIIGGQTRWMSVETVPRESPVHGLIWEGVMIDVTERKQREIELSSVVDQERSARHEAEEAALRRARFLAGVSHEIRTPLSAMVALTHSMLDECARHPLPAEFSSHLEQVRAGGYYLNHILVNLLDLHAVEQGSSPIRSEDFYLRDWVQDVANILDPIARAHHVTIHWQLPADDEARFESDTGRLSQILLNLVHNALKHGSRAGGCVQVEVALENGRLRLRVLDQGGESAVADANHRNPAGWDFDRGLGLGLSVVRENCRILQGSLDACASEYGGMEFCVELEPSPLQAS